MGRRAGAVVIGVLAGLLTTCAALGAIPNADFSNGTIDWSLAVDEGQGSWSVDATNAAAPGASDVLVLSAENTDADGVLLLRFPCHCGHLCCLMCPR